jgi:hypothetical protein
LALHFELFQFWLLIRGDIGNRKTTPQLGESESRRLPDLASRRVGNSLTRRVGESYFESNALILKTELEFMGTINLAL